MSQCNECGKNADELRSMPGEYGKTEFVCNDCVPKPGTHDITGEYHLRCPACKSTKHQEVSEQYWFSRPGGLFHCERSHLFTIIKIAQEVRIPGDHEPKKLQRLDVTGDVNLSCPVCSSTEHKIVQIEGRHQPHSQLLYECDEGHLFEVHTLTEDVWIPDD